MVLSNINDSLPQQDRSFPSQTKILQRLKLFPRLQRYTHPKLLNLIFLGDDKDYLATSRFFQRKFIKLNKSSEKEVYAHFTNATGLSSFPQADVG